MSNAFQTLPALEQRLAAMGDKRYAKFNEGLIPGKAAATYGVRIPALRALGRELCHSDWRAFLENPSVQASTQHEVVMLAGLVTAGAPCSRAERMERTAAFVPRIDNWSTNDTVCATYRIPKADRTAWLAFLQPYLTCRKEFSERFAVILLMGQFLHDDTVDAVLAGCLAAQCPGYYTKMAVSWALCTAFCKYRDKTLHFLNSPQAAQLDDWTFNKMIQKCRESHLVSDTDKALLLQRKRSCPSPQPASEP